MGTPGVFNDVVPFSAGHATAQQDGNDCRALGLLPTQINYYARATDPANDADLGSIWDPAAAWQWASAMGDQEHWHHLCVVDDGQTVHVFLDGQGVALRKRTISPKTASGFQVGGWGDGSRSCPRPSGAVKRP